MNSMRRNFLLLLLVLSAGVCFAQVDPTRDVKWTNITVSGSDAPSQACTSSNYGQPFQRTDVTPNKFGTCGVDGWQYRGSASTGFPSATLGQMTIFDGSTWIVAPNTYWAATTDTLSTISAKCSTTPITLLVNIPLSFAPGAPVVFPKCLNVLFYGSGKFTNSVPSNKITFSTPVQGTELDQHLSTGFAFAWGSNGGNNQVLPIEWVAGKGDHSTDNSTPMTTAASLIPNVIKFNSGQYLFGTTWALSSSGSIISPSVIGVSGSNATASDTELIYTGAAGTDAITLTNYSNAEIAHFNLYRTTKGTGSATGINITNAASVEVHHTIIEDFINQVKIHNFGRVHFGSIHDNLFTWGWESSGWGSETVCGLNIDAGSDAGNPSVYFDSNEAVTHNITSLDSYGVCGAIGLTNTHLADVRIDRLSTGSLKWGVKLNLAGAAGGFRDNDISITNSLLDAVYGGAVWLTGGSIGNTANVMVSNNECALISNAANVACYYADSTVGAIFSNNTAATTSGSTAPGYLSHNSRHIVFNADSCILANGSTGSCGVIDGGSNVSINGSDFYAAGGPTVLVENNAASSSVNATNLDGTGVGLVVNSGSSHINALTNTWGSGLSSQVTDNGTADLICQDSGCNIGGSSFPSSAGFVWNTSTSAARNGTVTDLASLFYVADSGALNAYAATLAYAPSGYVNGMTVTIKPGSTNTTTNPTLNVNGLGAVVITKQGAAALAAGDVASGTYATFQYDSAGPRFQLLNPQTVGAAVNSVTATAPLTANGTSGSPQTGAVTLACPTCSVGSGTSAQINTGAALGTLAITGEIPITCNDTSGSGTAQVCTSTPSFTPQSGNCLTYTTTTANSGTGLTLNINSLGAKSVAVSSPTGWTTSLTATSSIPASKPMKMCYDGTNWNAFGTGFNSGVKTETHTASNSATLNFTTCLSAAADAYEIVFKDVLPVSDAVNIGLRYSTDNGATYVTSSANYDWISQTLFFSGGSSPTSAVQGLNADTMLQLADGQTSTATGAMSGTFTLAGVNSVTDTKKVNGIFGNRSNSGQAHQQTTYGGGTFVTTSVVTDFQVLASSGNISSGSVSCTPKAQ